MDDSMEPTSRAAALLLLADEAVRRWLHDALAARGLEVTDFRDLDTLLESAKDHHLPLVVVDAAQSDLARSVRRLRREDRGAHSLIAVCVRGDTERLVPALLDAGADHVMRTDLGLDVLESRITLLLNRLDYRRTWRLAEARLQHLAYHDALTGLPNRSRLMAELATRIQGVAHTRGRRIALYFLDLDRFKVINDSLGHNAGDQLMREAARRLRESVLKGGLVARAAGDEFMIMVESGADDHELVATARRLQDRLREPCLVDGHSLVMSASIGIAASSVRTETAEELLRDASTAMFRAKREGGARHRLFDDSMHAEAMERLHTETELRRALDRNELALYMQPVYSLAEGRLEAFESLVRWHHPERGVLLPEEFLPVAEETGLILPIGEWVLQEAWSTISDWYRRALVPPQGITVSVNLSNRELLQPDLSDRVRGLLNGSSLEPSRLALEVTEEAVIEAEDARMVHEVAALGELGVKLWIDDFGTGTSSLSHLYRLRVDLLKIDRSFVTGMAVGSEAREIVRTILALADAVGIDTLAEGVETAAQREALLELGCAYAQGSFYAEPLARDDAERLLRREKKRG